MGVRIGVLEWMTAKGESSSSLFLHRGLGLNGMVLEVTEEDTVLSVALDVCIGVLDWMTAKVDW